MEIVALLVALVAVGLAVGAFLVVRSRRAGRDPLRPPAPAAPPAVPPAVRAGGLGARIRSLLSGRAPTQDDWRALEEVLIRADVGPVASADLVARVRDRFTPDSDPAELVQEEVLAILGQAQDLDLRPGELSVLMVVGVNGTGKTTSIGKLAARLAGEGRRVSLANSDTFRAAASEQLGVWAERSAVQLIAQSRGADPGAVAFDAVEAARARGADVLIVDTAGRLHTRQPLMDELSKVKRVLEKAAGDVEEVLLVVDATTGQNGIAQARAFTEAVDVSGVILTKLDGTAKGGVVLAVREELGVPVKLIGTGESLGDLEPFDPQSFARRLLDA